ncbi:hypothetical protein [Anaerolentibacter hominis]|uniref:hypothetical protein n=1 Tax=Anaerolentibacter hominis TaxID=3079009 RepID=UPI0031B89600
MERNPLQKRCLDCLNEWSRQGSTIPFECIYEDMPCFLLRADNPERLRELYKQYGETGVPYEKEMLDKDLEAFIKQESKHTDMNDKS